MGDAVGELSGGGGGFDVRVEVAGSRHVFSQGSNLVRLGSPSTAVAGWQHGSATYRRGKKIDLQRTKLPVVVHGEGCH